MPIQRKCTLYPELEARVNAAISALKQGKNVIVLDDEKRENEGDIIFPASLATPEKINFLLRHTSGIICLAMHSTHARVLDLAPMVAERENSSRFHTPFTVSIEAKEGVTTGVSAHDRARTIQVAANPHAKPDELARPGHVFPLIAENYGVLKRAGHTEASVDLVKLSGFYPTAVLCELMNEDGSMMKGAQITAFAKKHQIPLLSIEDIRRYRLRTETIIQKAVSTPIPFKHYKMLDMTVFIDPVSETEITVLSKNITDNPLVRIHSSCMTGDLFGSLKCDCQSQLHHALNLISKEGGILIYLMQEGRNIGLVNKLKAYELQRLEGLDTVAANQALNLPVDARCYDAAIRVLKYFAIHECRLLSNNPEKCQALQMCGIKAEMQSSQSEIQPWNKTYLKTKKTKLQHRIEGVI